MKIAFILGTRPEILKLAPVILEVKKRGCDYIIIHTNQHYNYAMDRVFFEELDLPQATYNLHVGSDMHGAQTGKMMMGIEEIILKELPSCIVVQGDTNTVLAGALVGSKLGIKVAHVESGLRSYDRTMPEEINRILVDHISDYLFCPTKKQRTIALAESISEESLYITGNTIVDALAIYTQLSTNKSTILRKLKLLDNKFALLTCHRPSNVDVNSNIEVILCSINNICEQEKMVCIFPTHPRLKKISPVIKDYDNIHFIDPVGYLDMIQLELHSRYIFTDSGGIQEEACVLEKKCLILRTNTERPEVLDVGGAVLINEISTQEIEKQFNILKNREVDWRNPFGDGKASQRIVNILCGEKIFS